MADGFSLELIQVRRILEPAATALAATRIDAATIGELQVCLRRMRESESEEELVQYDAHFHAVVAAASGNATLASMLNGVSSRTLRSRIWRGVVEEEAKATTLAQHGAILSALGEHDPTLAEAAALVHVATTEDWFRRMIVSPVSGIAPRREVAADLLRPG